MKGEQFDSLSPLVYLRFDVKRSVKNSQKQLQLQVNALVLSLFLTLSFALILFTLQQMGTVIIRASFRNVLQR